MLASSVLPSPGQRGSEKCLGVCTLGLRLGPDHTLSSRLSALCMCEHTHVRNGCAHALCTTHPAGFMPMGSFPSSQEPTVCCGPFRDQAGRGELWRWEATGGPVLKQDGERQGTHGSPHRGAFPGVTG